MYINFLVLLSNLLFLSSFMSKFVSADKSGSLKLFLRTGSHKHRKDDVFIIPGKGCKTPLLLLEGGHKTHHRGQTNIIMQNDCEQEVGHAQNTVVEHKTNNVIPFPIPIPVFKHYYHHHNLGHHYQQPMQWMPYTDIEHHMQTPIEYPPYYHLGAPVIENRHSLDHEYLNHPVHSHSHFHSKPDFVDNILTHVGNALAYH